MSGGCRRGVYRPRGDQRRSRRTAARDAHLCERRASWHLPLRQRPPQYDGAGGSSPPAEETEETAEEANENREEANPVAGSPERSTDQNVICNTGPPTSAAFELP